MIFGCFICGLFVLVAGITIWRDKSGSSEIGKFFMGSGALVALIFGVLMLRGAA